MTQSLITPPPDAAQRRRARPVVVYAVEHLPPFDTAFYEGARRDLAKVGELVVPPRDGRSLVTKGEDPILA